MNVERAHDPVHRLDDQLLVGNRYVLGREHSHRVAGMDAGPLDVLQQPRDQDRLAVGNRVDVHLHALEVAVDPDRPIGVDDGRPGELVH